MFACLSTLCKFSWVFVVFCLTDFVSCVPEGPKCWTLKTEFMSSKPFFRQRTKVQWSPHNRVKVESQVFIWWYKHKDLQMRTGKKSRTYCSHTLRTNQGDKTQQGKWGAGDKNKTRKVKLNARHTRQLTYQDKTGNNLTEIYLKWRQRLDKKIQGDTKETKSMELIWITLNQQKPQYKVTVTED